MSVPLVRRARTDELDEVLRLLTGVLPWLRRHELDQWSTWPAWRTKLAGPLARGDTWLLTLDSTAVGTVTLEHHGDPALWTPAELATPAVYLSKLAVDRGYAGRRLGADLLAWAADRAQRHDRQWLRLDAWKTNHRLHEYYVRAGFTHVRTCDNPQYRTGALFQIPASRMDTTARGGIREWTGRLLAR